MEIILRCALDDRPGALARLAGAIAEVGGDIQAVDVVETAGGRALDDLVVAVDPAKGRRLADTVRALEGVELVHAGMSRGHPGDAVFRLAVGLEALLNGAMNVDHGVQVLVGGLLRADEADFTDEDEAPAPDPRTLVLPCGERMLVLRRAYRFTETEQRRAEAVLRVCQEASGRAGPA